MHDNFNLTQEEGPLNDVDVYFKPSYQLGGYDSLTNNPSFVVLPLGFNYSVYANASFLWQRTLLQSGIKKKIELFARGQQQLARLLKLNTSIAYSHVDAMQQAPQKKAASILLMTRLWNPHTVTNPYKKEIRQHLNEQRINAIRALKKEFGHKFTGGLFIDAYSSEVAADIVLPNNRWAAKPNYLQQLKQHAIGVTVNGKFSAGWSFGENIAFSNAIVADGLSVEVPGNFKEATHFLSFTQADQCVEACVRLFENPDLLAEMQTNNWEYYQQYLHPAKLMLGAIETALKK